MRLVLPQAGDDLRRAGNCTCLDLVCEEHHRFVPWCPKDGSLILGPWSAELWAEDSLARGWGVFVPSRTFQCGVFWGAPRAGHHSTLPCPVLCKPL